MVRHDGGSRTGRGDFGELHVTAFLTDLNEPRDEELSANLAVGKGSQAAAPTLHLDVDDLGWDGGDGGFEIKFEPFTQMVQCFLFSLSVAGDIDLVLLLGDVPWVLFPDMSGKYLFHIDPFASQLYPFSDDQVR